MCYVDYSKILQVLDIPKEYKPTHVTSLLILFAKPKKDQKIIADLGCGVGISSVMVSNTYNVNVTGFDADENAIEIGKKLVDLVKPKGKVELLNISVENVINQSNFREKFDLVISNPPYHFEGIISPNPVKERIRRSSLELIETFIKASYHILRNKGELLIVLPPLRLVNVFEIMRRLKMEPKLMIPVYGRSGKDCELIVLRGRKNGKTGLEIKSPVFLSK